MNILKIKNFILSIIGLFLSNFLINAQAVIYDTTINTDLVSLPVYGFTDDWTNKTITYTFKTNWAHFQLLDIVANDNSAVLDDDMKYSYDWENNLIKITIKSIKPYFDGILFNIVVRVLPRVDYYFVGEILEITPMEIAITDGSNSSTIVLDNKTATIRINYIQSNLTYKSDVSLNYPNPFGAQTVVLFSLSETSTVSIEIYNTLGTLIQSIPVNGNAVDNAFICELTNSNHNTIQIVENNVLEKGLYCIKLITNHSILANSEYYLIIHIGDATHTIKMGVN